nr:helix-turn-helix transcriptional regulator [uncultured Oscillibacter sp.]
MGSKTNLRTLRYRHHITLAQMASCAGLSGQYISRAELGEIAATPRLEVQMSAALEAVISKRRTELQALETDYMTYKGSLLKKGEHPHEQ